MNKQDWLPDTFLTRKFHRPNKMQKFQLHWLMFFLRKLIWKTIYLKLISPQNHVTSKATHEDGYFCLISDHPTYYKSISFTSDHKISLHSKKETPKNWTKFLGEALSSNTRWFHGTFYSRVFEYVNLSIGIFSSNSLRQWWSLWKLLMSPDFTWSAKGLFKTLKACAIDINLSKITKPPRSQESCSNNRTKLFPWQVDQRFPVRDEKAKY